MNRKRRNRLLAYLMILAMLCTIFPTAALANEGQPDGAASQKVLRLPDNTAIAGSGSDGQVRAMDAGTANSMVTTVGGNVTNDCVLMVQPIDEDYFTIAVLPDTQFYARDCPEIFEQQTQWIADNAQSQNIAFVAHLGDIQNDFDDPVQWQNAKEAMDIIRAAGIPYALAPGNHDLDFKVGDPAQFDHYFPYTDFTSYSWYGGHYPEDSNTSSYQLFSIMGHDFIILNLVCTPALLAEATDWANGILNRYNDRKAIVVTHGYIKSNGEYAGGDSVSGIAIRNNIVKKHSNVIAVLCGHINGQYHGVDTGDNGNTVYNFLTDYTDQPNGGNGWLRLYQFYPLQNKIRAVTYSPYLDQYDTSAKGQFELSLQFEETPGPGDAPQYTITPVAAESVYEVGETGGIKTMTVNTGVSGLKYFGAQITPIIEHEGKEAVVFTHLHGGVQLSLNITRADFDLVGQAQAGFNVQGGDMIKVYIVDDLTNDVTHNPALFNR